MNTLFERNMEQDDLFTNHPKPTIVDWREDEDSSVGKFDTDPHSAYKNYEVRLDDGKVTTVNVRMGETKGYGSGPEFYIDVRMRTSQTYTMRLANYVWAGDGERISKIRERSIRQDMAFTNMIAYAPDDLVDDILSFVTQSLSEFPGYGKNNRAAHL